MSRDLPRLADWRIKTKDPSYIHYYFLLRDIQGALRQFALGRLLDLGCGNKPYESLYGPLTSERVGCDVVQSDRNKVDVVCPATALAFPNESFDSVLSTQVMEHVVDHRQMLREAYRVLRPGGVCILTVPFAWELHEEPYDFFRFTRHGLRQLFTDAGFQVEYIKPNGGKWAAVYQLRTNALYHTFRTRKGLLTKLRKILFIDFRLTQLRNHFAIWLDQNFYSDVFTLNYIVVARKPTQA